MKAIVFLFLVGLTSEILAAEPDVFLVFEDCKILVGSLDNGTLNVGPGDAPSYACSRGGEILSCTVTYASGDRPKGDSQTDTFEILLDSPPFLYFAPANNQLFFAVNSATRVTVMTARMVDTTFAAQKGVRWDLRDLVRAQAARKERRAVVVALPAA